MYQWRRLAALNKTIRVTTYNNKMKMKARCILIMMMTGVMALTAYGQTRTGAAQKPAAGKKPVAGKKAAVSPSPVQTNIAATYIVKDKKVMIRWAPTTEAGWRLGNKYGYVVERRVLMQDGKMVNSLKRFMSYLVISDSLQYWANLIDSNDNAAVMAQAMYGETFDVDISSQTRASGGGASLLGKSEENKQRFLFAMYAADNDYSVAAKAGLGFTDRTVRPNEKYFYRIYSAAPKKLVKCDTALLMVSLQDYTELPQSPEILVEPSNNSVVLSWDMERTKNYYNAFYIQRSADGGEKYEEMSKEPYTSFGQGNDPRLPNAIVFVDTTVQPGMQYKYRVCGVSIFGERGPWSPVAQGGSLPLLEGVPGIQGIRLDAGGRAMLSWYYEDSIRPKIKGFELNWAAAQDGVYEKVVSNIGADASEIPLPDSLAAGYLIVKAVSKEGISRTSFPYLYQPEDSLPPHFPVGIKAAIDSNGHVELKWLPNTEKDLLGYKVFRTMVKGAEPAILVDTVWRNTTFYDTLDMNLKNRKIYYTVTALDYRFNQSAPSPAIEVVKKDVIPPTAPVFANYNLREGAVELTWVNTTDEDVAEMMVQRRNTTTTAWTTIFRTAASKQTTAYTDQNVEADKKYSYRLVAVDESGLQSPEAQVLTVQTLPVVNRKIIKSLDSDLNRDKRLIYLRWQLLEKTALVRSIEIFKGNDKEPMSLYKVVDGKTIELLDNDLVVNTKYKYGIRVLLSNGQYSEMMTKEINY
jgi:fibronectin type 3 domain-containing protein